MCFRSVHCASLKATLIPTCDLCVPLVFTLTIDWLCLLLHSIHGARVGPVVVFGCAINCVRMYGYHCSLVQRQLSRRVRMKRI